MENGLNRDVIVIYIELAAISGANRVGNVH